MTKKKELVQDVYGLALMDYFKSPKDQVINVHSDIAETDSYPVSWFFRETAEFPDLEKAALDLCAGKILDIGAGTGIHALELQKSKHNCTAIDISTGSVEIMQKRGVKNAKELDFYTIENEKYDTLLMLMNGFGIMGKMSGIPQFFEKADALLAENGQILADSSDLIHLYKENDGSVMLDLNGAYYGEISYQMEFDGKMGEPFPWLFIDFGSLKSEAEKSGFEAVKIFEESDGHYLAKITRM